ncbi:hypothetical protein HMPREF1551_02525 [Capnocytophaga sp. oral taxon 863 str. F0517]|nr:hypothetical protein HMPREF1551_02525 [Capnocytophaga sp. oral taxon 863 str. F0517]
MVVSKFFRSFLLACIFLLFYSHFEIRIPRIFYVYVTILL